MMKFPQKSIQAKVFMAFFILLAVGLVTFFYSYVGIAKLFKTFNSAPASTNKLTLINQTLVKIYESESNAKLYAASGDISYLEAYTNQNVEIDSNLQVLRNVAYDVNQQLQLANIIILQTQKVKVVDELIKVLMQEVKLGDYTNLIKSQPDTVRMKFQQKVYSTSSLPSVATPTVRKRTFFERVKAIFKEDQVTNANIDLGSKHQIDSSTITQVRIDGNIGELKRKIRQMRIDEEQMIAENSIRKVELLKREKLLNDRILFQITQMSHEEIRINNEQMQKFDEASMMYKRRLFLLGISSFFIVLVFLFLIFRDIRLSARMQKQLEDSNLKIQDLLKVKERFLANMSHEIRTPLTAITGFSDYLMKTKSYSEEEMGAINSSAKHLHSIVNEILDFSKVESNAVEFEYSVFSIETLLKEIVMEMKIKVQEKAIDLILKIGDGPDFVKMDRLRLKQVLLNLLSNAIKFTNEGSVSMFAHRQQDKYVVEVTDTGIGIPESAQSKIFDEFTQADGSVARRFGGTGLGLSISKKLIEQMGGALTLRSKENEGSTFSVAFNESGIVANVVPEQTASAAEFCYKGKILFIDDDAFLRLLASKLLQSNNIPFDVATGGTEGLELFSKGNYSMVITDLHMPGMSGVEVARSIRATDTAAQIIFLSADMSRSMIDEMYAAGATFVLQKPFSEQELLNAIAGAGGSVPAEIEGEMPLPMSKSICDISKITAFIGDDHDELKTIVNAFLSSTEESIEVLEQGNQSQNGVQVAERAHKMLTGFRQFDIKDGVACLREIEKCRNGRPLEEVQNEIDELLGVWRQAKKELSEYV